MKEGNLIKERRMTWQNKHWSTSKKKSLELYLKIIPRNYMIINFKCFITVSLLKRLEMKTQRLPQPLYTKSFHLQIKCYKPKKKKKKNK